MSTWKVVALLKFVKWRFFRQRQVRMRNFHSFSNRCFFMNQDTHDCKRLKNLRNTWSLYCYFIDRPFVRLFLSNILILFSVNLAAKRPAKASQDNDNAYRGCDQKIGIVLFCTQMCIYLQTFYHNKLFACSVFTNLVRLILSFVADKSFSINEDHVPLWWRVDLIAVCKVHLVRIVTATGYKPADLKGLKVLGKLSNTCVRPLSQSNLISYSSRRKSQSTLATCPLTNSSCEWIFGISTLTGDGAKVGSLDSPTAEPVQTIILSKDTRKRIVSLFLEKFPAKLQFREVEIYNGPLLGNDIHVKAILMIGVKSCTFTWAPFDAELFME